MKITLDVALAVAQLITILVFLPSAAFRAWRKIDERLTSQDTKLARIEYALFNEGRGMEQQLKEVHRNQQAVITDLAVLKVKNA
jgi:hypothetical protein